MPMTMALLRCHLAGGSFGMSKTDVGLVRNREAVLDLKLKLQSGDVFALWEKKEPSKVSLLMVWQLTNKRKAPEESNLTLLVPLVKRQPHGQMLSR